MKARASRCRTISKTLASLVLLGFAADGVMAADDPVLQKGFKHTRAEEELVGRAIGTTNALLAGHGRALALAGTWQATKPSAGVETVPLYLVSSPAKATTTPAAVPRGCRCVFVNPSAFQAFMKEQTAGPARMSLDAKYVLTFMLLHEVGHLTKRTPGAEFASGELSQLNLDPSLEKASEREADSFAAEVIRGVLDHKKGTMPGIEAAWVSQALVALSWNMQAYISLDNFGATAVGSPSVFFDKNLSHPNLVWRVLSVNYLIQQTDVTRDLLESFERARQRGANPEPLYVKPGHAKG